MSHNLLNGAPKQQINMTPIPWERTSTNNLTLCTLEGVAMLHHQQQQQQFTSGKEIMFSHGFFVHVPGEQWIALFITILVCLLTRRWQKSRQQGQQMKRNQSGILQIARDSSAASLATLKQVSSSASFARLSEAVRSLKCFQTVVATISAPNFFVRSDLVQKLSLQELSTIISYASECNRMGFDDVAFLADLPPHVKEIIAAIDTAVLRSRGVNVRLSQVAAAKRTTTGSDFDALYFCAAMRLLVEWRSIKIVPEEYKAYAVGMNVAKRDFVQNSAKTEDAVHRWIENEITSGKEDAEVSSPTIRQILHYEAIHNVHTRLPKLKDKTAAIGIVWMSRQLLFQSQIFANVTKVPTTYGSAMEAVRAAYKTVFNPYHGWAIQQVFNYAFNGAPPVSVLFRLMNPNVMENLKDCEPDADTVMVDYQTAVPTSIESSFTSSIMDESDDDDMVTCGSRSIQEEGFDVIKLGREIKGNWEKFAGNVEQGWSNFVDNVVLKGRNNKRERALSQDTSQSSATATSGDVYSDSGGSDEAASAQNSRPSLISNRSCTVPAFVLNEDALQQYVEKETIKTAHIHIEQYLTIVHPLLKELISTINDFNMNDPSRV